MAIPKVQWASRIHYLVSTVVLLMLLWLIIIFFLLIHLRQIIPGHIMILLHQNTFMLLFYQTLNFRVDALLLWHMIRSFNIFIRAFLNSFCSLVIGLSSCLRSLLEELMAHQLRLWLYIWFTFRADWSLSLFSFTLLMIFVTITVRLLLIDSSFRTFLAEADCERLWTFTLVSKEVYARESRWDTLLAL